MSFHKDDEKLLEKYIAIWTKFDILNVPEDDIECASFTVISIDSLFVYKKNITYKYI